MQHLSLLFALLLVLGLPFNTYAQAPIITAANAATVQPIMVIGRGQAHDVAWSSDGQWLAVGSSIGLWLYEVPSLLANPTTATPLGWPTSAIVRDVAFSPTQPLVAAALANGEAFVWDWQTDEPRFFNAHQLSTRALAFSPDGQMLATVGVDNAVRQEGDARLWDVESLTLAVDMRDPSNVYHTNTLAFSPDGQWLATGNDDGDIRLWRMPTGSLAGEFAGHRWEVQSMAFSPDSQWLISGATDDKVLVWNVATFAEMSARSYDAGGDVYAVAVSPDGTRTAALSAEPQLHIALATGGLQAVVNLMGQSGTVGGIAFSPDGNLLAVIGGDGPTHVGIWDVTSTIPVQKLAIPDFYRGLVALAETHNQILGVGIDRVIHRWSSPDLGYLGMWDIQSQHRDFINDIALHPNSNTLVTADLTGAVRRWDIADQRLDVQYNEGRWATGVAFNDDGSRLVIGGWSEFSQVWQQPDSQLLFRLPSAEIISSVAIRPGTPILAVGLHYSGDIELWNISTGAWVATLERGHSNVVEDIAFSPDGELMASAGGRFDHKVVLWDMISQTQLTTLRGHSAGVMAVAFTHDGTIVASGGWDGRVILWNALDGSQLAVLVGHTHHVYDVAFSRDGTRLYSASLDGTIRVWGISMP